MSTKASERQAMVTISQILLRQVMAKGSISKLALVHLFTELVRGYGAGSAKIAKSLTLKRLLESMNEDLGPLGFGIKSARDEVEGKLYYAFINKTDDSIAKLATGAWEEWQVALFKRIFDACVTSSLMEGGGKGKGKGKGKAKGRGKAIKADPDDSDDDEDGEADGDASAAAAAAAGNPTTYTTSTGTKYTGRGAGLADLHDLLNELRVQATSSAGGFASVFKGKALPALLAAVDTLNAQGWVTYVHGAEESDGITFVTLGPRALAELEGELMKQNIPDCEACGKPCLMGNITTADGPRTHFGCKAGKVERVAEDLALADLDTAAGSSSSSSSAAGAASAGAGTLQALKADGKKRALVEFNENRVYSATVAAEAYAIASSGGEIMVSGQKRKAAVAAAAAFASSSAGDDAADGDADADGGAAASSAGGGAAAKRPRLSAAKAGASSKGGKRGAAAKKRGKRGGDSDDDDDDGDDHYDSGAEDSDVAPGAIGKLVDDDLDDDEEDVPISKLKRRR